MPKTAAIIPAYNEQDRIIDVLQGIEPFVEELLVIDDGSTDKTAELASHFARVISLDHNMGYIAAIKHGFLASNADIYILIDADGEFDPSDIPALLEPILIGDADMVQASREGPIRASEYLLNTLAKLFGDVGDSGTGLRAIRACYARRCELVGRCICGIFALEVISYGGKVVDVPVEIRKTQKPRKWLWLHGLQCFYILRLAISIRLGKA